MYVSSVQISSSVVFYTLQPHGLQYDRLPCPSQTPGDYSNSCQLSRWCHPTISSSVSSFFSLQSFPHQGLFKWVSSLHQVAKLLEFQLQHQSFQWIFRTDFLSDWLVWSPCSPRDSQESSLAPVFWHSAIFVVHLSYPYMTTEKTISLTRQIFVSKVMSLLFSMLSGLVIAFLPRSKHLLISWPQSPSAVILEPKKIKSFTVSMFPYLFAMKWWMPWSLFFECWVLSQLFHSSFTFIKRLFSSFLLYAIRVVSSAYLGSLIFLLAIMF